MPEQILKGIPASDGIAIGPAYCYRPLVLNIPDRIAESVESEMASFRFACAQAALELQNLHASIKTRVGETEAAIFEAHQMMLADPMLEQKIYECVRAGNTIESAVLIASNQLADLLAGMTDELFAARAMDVKDVGRRILRILLGLPDTALDAVQEPSIIVANDLSPSDTASLNPNFTLGFVTAQGGLTSHSAILARTLGIPAIVGLGETLVEAVSTQPKVALDGKAGTLVISPTPETIQRFHQQKTEGKARLQILMMAAKDNAHTANGRRVEIAANVGDAASTRDAIANGAEGVGLLRTEFLYLEDAQPPGEDKQIQIYREIFEVMAGRPVIVRTLDIGGDKPPSYFSFPQEMNPFLGWRAIRISLEEQALFKTQIRAILRAARKHNVRIMLPMVSDLEQVQQAREIVESVKLDLKRDSVEFAEDVPLGIMVETPAAAVLVDILAEASDFFSLGTNDLTQYTLAVDRGNAKVAHLFQPLHPAVLRLIKETIDAAHAQGKWVGMCGELAGMQKAIPILLGLGLDEFSMNPRAIPEAKHLIGQLIDEQAREIAAQAISLRTAAEIEDHMSHILASLQ